MNRSFCLPLVVIGLLAGSFVFSLSVTARNSTACAYKAAVPAATPVYTGYKGVKIGMTDEEARKILGTPKEKGDTQDYFVFSDKESAQVLYIDHKVVTVSVTYIGESASVPKPKDVFGEDAEVKPDGSISKVVRYEKDGFSIAYNKTGGDDPLILITVQKLYGG